MDKPSFLAQKNAHERDSHISFEEAPHIYTIDGDSDYMSVTSWNHSHFPLKRDQSHRVQPPMKGK